MGQRRKIRHRVGFKSNGIAT